MGLGRRLTGRNRAGNVPRMLILHRLASRLLVALLVAIVAPACASAAENEEVKVDLYVTVPADTAPDATVYLAGNLSQVGEWRADGVKLNRLENGEYHAQLKLPRGRSLEYKITRGSWETVEKGAGGEELHNRTLALEKDAVERVKVAAWRSDAPTTGATTQPRKSTVTGDVRVHADFRSKHLANGRRLLVYVPPDYEKNTSARYPVLYMHDGQNVFDDATSFAGEWRADETAEQLIRAGKIEPIIIVAIENAGGERADEYTPSAALGTGGRGDLYVRFVVEEVKPFIDKTYRTRADREHAGIAGSSLGGLVSLHAVKQRPDVFGRCAAVSPSLWWGLGTFLRDAERDASWAKGTRLWLDMGTRENDDPEKSKISVDEAAAFAAALEKSGLVPAKDFVWRPVEGAAHNEQAWADRFDEILVYLYGQP